MPSENENQMEVDENKDNLSNTSKEEMECILADCEDQVPGHKSTPSTPKTAEKLDKKQQIKLENAKKRQEEKVKTKINQFLNFEFKYNQNFNLKIKEKKEREKKSVKNNESSVKKNSKRKRKKKNVND